VRGDCRFVGLNGGMKEVKKWLSMVEGVREERRGEGVRGGEESRSAWRRSV
jgi:hypothetical protein